MTEFCISKHVTTYVCYASEISTLFIVTSSFLTLLIATPKVHQTEGILLTWLGNWLRVREERCTDLS